MSIPKGYPTPRVPSPTKSEDWQIGGQQDAAGKVQMIFAGQSPAFPDLVPASELPASSASTPTPPPTQTPSPSAHKIRRRPDKMKGPGFNWRGLHWPLYISALAVVILLAHVLMRFASMSGLRDNLGHEYLNQDLTRLGAPPVVPCLASEEVTLRESLDELAATYEATYFREEPTVDDRALLERFLKPARVAQAVDCLGGVYCRQDFTNPTLQKSVIRHLLAYDLSLVPGHSEPAGTFMVQLYSMFGTKQVDLATVPDLDYQAADETFIVPTPVDAPTPAYDYTLEASWISPSEDEAVYQALMTPTPSCTLSLHGQCSCPLARYYLVLRYDPESDHWMHAYHFVRRLGGIDNLQTGEQVTAPAASDSTNVLESDKL